MVSEFESKVLAARDRIMARPGPKKAKKVHLECPSGAPGALEWSRAVPKHIPGWYSDFKEKNRMGTSVGSFRDIDSCVILTGATACNFALTIIMVTFLVSAVWLLVYAAILGYLLV